MEKAKDELKYTFNDYSKLYEIINEEILKIKIS